MLFQRVRDRIFQIGVRLLKRRIHLDRKHFFAVRGQGVRNIFERYERRQIHQVLSEKQG